MSAGTGVVHSEFNPSKTDLVHLLQIWILPNARGLTPEYEQETFKDGDLRDTLRVVAAPDGRDGAAVSEASALTVTASEPAEILLFDLA